MDNFSEISFFIESISSKFKSSSIEQSDKGYLMKGDMTIKGISNKVKIDFTYSDKTFTGTTKIYTNDYNFFEKKNNKEDSKVLIRITIPIL